MARRKGQVVTDTIVRTGGDWSELDSKASLEQLAVQLMDRARDEGVSLVGPGGLLSGLTKTVLESALEGELTEHLGYDPYDPAGHHSGNSRNGTRKKTVLTEIGPIELEVPRDRAGSFEPVIVPKRRRRLNGVDALVCSLSAKGLTHGEICAHLAEIYGAEVSKETITRITDRVLEGMSEWQNRPLDAVYPVMFIDAITMSRSARARWRIGPSTWPSVSPWTAPATFWVCGRARAARAPSTGRTC
jgi:putative transposase